MRLARYPPVVGLALAAGAGLSSHHLGIHPLWMFALLPVLLFLNRSSSRPSILPWAISAAIFAGLLLGYASAATHARDCRLLLREGDVLHLDGLLVGPMVEGGAEFFPLSSEGGRCLEPLRLIVPEGAGGGRLESGPVAAGMGLRVRGTWRKSHQSLSGLPLRAGYLRVDSLKPLTGPRPGPETGANRVRKELVLLGGWVQRRIEILFPRTSSLAVALVWARKDGLSAETRDAFARAGTAHLLAISGFHVGVVAGVLVMLVGWTGLSHPSRYLLASFGVWAYVVAIGLPDAAFRAAVLLSVLSLGRLWNRRVAAPGALATAFLGFLLADPGALLHPGFQLSFAGALGLVVGYRPVSSWIRARSKGSLPMVLCQGVGAGVAATVATLPLVAWHFGRISLIGIAITLFLTPLVAAAIPGIFLSLITSAIHLGTARFLASGVEALLAVIWTLVNRASALPFASVWVSRPVLVSCLLAWGVALVLVLTSHRARMWPRWAVFSTATMVGGLIWPMAGSLLQRGSVEIVVLDVGQGDATLLRSPGGRWILLDAGPRTRTFDAGERRVLPYLRRRGVHHLELMILTHPDMDHVGGAASVLQELPVTTVLGPGVPAGTEVFLDALGAAAAADRPWITVRAGDSLNLDGMALRIVAPEDSLPGVEEEGSNAASLVLELRFGSFAALLTGDAPALSEDGFLPRVLSDRIQILKVGHHGSSTSTTPGLLRRIEPAAALISVGRRNRFGHPHPGVLARLADDGIQVFRTDDQGTLTVRAGADGSYSVSTQFQ